MKEILRLFPPSFQKVLLEKVGWGRVQEIRLRVERPIEVISSSGYSVLDSLPVTADHLSYVLNQISQFSLYRFKDELKEGFITIEGGHRVGLAGKANTQEDKVETLKHISFMNIRVARSTKGQVSSLLPHLYDEKGWRSALIIGPPHSGKTTLLRELASVIGSPTGSYPSSKVAVVDERSEIAASLRGVPQLDVGARTDVMDACPKADGMMMMIRSMSPDVLIVDEIGGEKDARAVQEAVYTGVKVICSIHGTGVESVSRRPSVSGLLHDQVFERYINLERLSAGSAITWKVYNHVGQVLGEGEGGRMDGVDGRRYHSNRYNTGRV
ncbi:stage III sporulation protein AA [Halobacillus litoralis]|uniref:Stage III sporulation protein AA n=1 Tax=Halobacillus litoralis TaxID=45668 RepID=A0A845DQ50_9BACI|nr:stage III sporulation protein AA [Halobacillus litoralis]MYL19741.1 stage III sporulation protein AA [Halobacillus litoralis]MYL37138.1 stage III sporulation protein AA [Halobacillus litoralis]